MEVCSVSCKGTNPSAWCVFQVLDLRAGLLPGPEVQMRNNAAMPFVKEALPISNNVRTFFTSRNRAPNRARYDL